MFSAILPQPIIFWQKQDVTVASCPEAAVGVVAAKATGEAAAVAPVYHNRMAFQRRKKNK